MSDKAHKHAAYATMHLTVVLVALMTAVMGYVAAYDQYSAHRLVAAIVASMMMIFVAANLVFLVIRITQLIDEIRHPEPEIDEELMEAYDQLDADGFIFDGDEIIRYEDDGRLYLCLDNGGASSIDLLLGRHHAGRWRLYLPGDEGIHVPMEYVGALRARVRQQDEQIASEIKGLST